MSNGPVLAFTLPVSCQICLGKVKQPVVCSNRHVFCSSCMDLWLSQNSHCPACRVAVTADNPCRPVIGGLSVPNDSDNDSFSSRALRRARIDLIFKDYEAEIERLQSELDSKSHQPSVLNAGDELTDCQDRLTHEQADGGIESRQLIDTLKCQLQQATLAQQTTNMQLDAIKQEVEILRDVNTRLERENQRLKVDLANRSPRRFGRLTVVALESKLEAREKEVQQLTRALEKTDEHISSLENELQMYHSRRVNSGIVTCTDNEQCSSAERDAVLTAVDTELTSSLSGICHQSTGSTCSSDDAQSTNSSCRKKLKFTIGGCI